jgi:predicted nucleotide-binding protein (sugar kinase/HSP70/actin superfamily)
MGRTQKSDLHRRLEGRTLLIPSMSEEGAIVFAAAFRSLGFQSEPTPPANERTLQLGARYTSGEECYPEKITLGDALRAIEERGADKVAFFMPTAEGPCRFGQYRPLLAKILSQLGLGQVPIVSPSSGNSYDGLGEQSGELLRTAWWALIVSDILRALRLRFRPYEMHKGETDRTTHECLQALSRVIEKQNFGSKRKISALIEEMGRCRERYQAIPLKNETRPLIGVVGEIFCRLVGFSNEELIRKIEEYGGECWLSGITEWVYYTNRDQIDMLIRNGRRFSKKVLMANIKNYVQVRDERRLIEPVRCLLSGREEPEDIREILHRSFPYLPYTGALGEMVLSVGKAIYLHDKGAAAIADISPFSCMNGIVCEAVYPRVSADHHSIPIRSFYFDGTQKTVDQEVDIFMELARNFQRKQRSH